MLLLLCLVFTFETGGSQIKDCETHCTIVTSKRTARSTFGLNHEDQRGKTEKTKQNQKMLEKKRHYI